VVGDTNCLDEAQTQNLALRWGTCVVNSHASVPRPHPVYITNKPTGLLSLLSTLANLFIPSLAVPLLGLLNPEGECCMILQNVVTMYQTVKRLVSSVIPLKGPGILYDFATS